jgi:hypothetical protein
MDKLHNYGLFFITGTCQDIILNDVKKCDV